MLERVMDLWGKFFFAEPDKLSTLVIAVVLVFLGLVFMALRIYRRPRRTFKSHYPLIGTTKFWVLITVAYVLLLAAWAWPYFANSRIIVKRGNVEIVVAIDVSASMYLKGIGMPRVDIATREIAHLLSTGVIKEGDKVSLYVFGLEVLRRVHLTKDIDAFTAELSKVGRPKDLQYFTDLPWGTNMTSLCRRIYSSLDALDEFIETGKTHSSNWKFSKKSNRLVIMLTDGDFFNYMGEDNISDTDKQKDKNDWEATLREFRKRGLNIYVVGIGARVGEKLSDILLDYKGEANYNSNLEDVLKNVVSPLDVATVEYMAKATGGEKFLIETANASAGDFLKRVINLHRSTSIESATNVNRIDLWPYFLFASLMVFAVAILFY